VQTTLCLVFREFAFTRECELPPLAPGVKLIIGIWDGISPGIAEEVEVDDITLDPFGLNGEKGSQLVIMGQDDDDFPLGFDYLIREGWERENIRQTRERHLRIVPDDKSGKTP